MDDDNLPSDSLLLTRYRSPTFTKDEVLLLLDLIEKYKDGLLNKSMSTFACRTKEILWMKIGKEYNKLNPSYERSTESIKIKWDNLKKVVRKLTNNLLDVDNHHLDDVNSRILSLLYEAENKNRNSNNDASLKGFNDQDDNTTQNDALTPDRETDLDDNCNYFDEDDEIEIDDTDIFRSHRSPDFRKEEIVTLISLVEKHLDVILDKSTKSYTNEAKEKVWILICKQFNSQTDTHRKAYQLKRKWDHLKTLSRKYKRQMKHEQTDESLEKVCELIGLYENKDNVDSTEDNCEFNDIELTETQNNTSNGLGFENSISDDNYYDENGKGYEKCTRSRFQGPALTRDEKMLLLSLVEKHLHIIMKKGTKPQTIEAKDRTWASISEIFNKNTESDFPRTAYQLKKKWDHLKRTSAQYKNKVNNNPEKDEVLEKVVEIINLFEGENKEYETTETTGDTNENDELTGTNNTSNEFLFEDSVFDDNPSNPILRNEHSKKFTPRECALLMHCVKQENKTRGIDSKPHKLKRYAWTRISKAYNRLSPMKRPTKMLMNKFKTLRKMTKSIPYKRTFSNTYKNRSSGAEYRQGIIKREPSEGSDADDCADETNMNDDHYYSNDATEFVQDPLTTVLNTDSGIDETTQFEDRDVIRLKIELLNYKKETAKLERKRIENAIESDTLEASLRLRAARLEAVAAAMRLPQSHPALIYTPEESRAQEYILQYQDT